MSENDDRRGTPDGSDLVEVARVYGPFEAELIQSVLESHGIPSVIRGRTAPFVYPLTVDGLAEFKVLVQKDDAEEARDLVAAKPAPDDDRGPQDPA
ncbi:MAG: DUF2007 domain-containing protein [Acidobacteriota bacterium]